MHLVLQQIYDLGYKKSSNFPTVISVVLHRDPETAQPVMIGNIQFNGGGLFESGGDAIHNEDSDHHQNLFTSHS